MGLFSTQHRIVERTQFDGITSYYIQSRYFNIFMWGDWNDDWRNPVGGFDSYHDAEKEIIRIRERVKEPMNKIIKTFK
jgi:uncharacterized protein YjlB